MHIRSLFALCGASIALSLTLAANAFAAGTQVSVRIEGKSHTLLPNTVVSTHAGSITKGGAPAGTCPATSAAGALDVATHGRWNGSYSTKYAQLSLTSILGETWTFSQKSYYWGIWVNNRYASTGMCQITLHRGDQILFAVDSATRHEHPLGLTAPRRANTRHTFRVRVVSYSDAGVAKPLAGVRIDGAVTNRSGTATITDKRTGKLTLTASRTGYIRSAPATVRVSR